MPAHSGSAVVNSLGSHQMSSIAIVQDQDNRTGSLLIVGAAGAVGVVH